MPDTLMAYTPLGSRADQELKSHGSEARVILTEVAASTMIDLRLDPRDAACVKAAGEADYALCRYFCGVRADFEGEYLKPPTGCAPAEIKRIQHEVVSQTGCRCRLIISSP